jgi:uncharacterized tellurite resistance protein B-like protein
MLDTLRRLIADSLPALPGATVPVPPGDLRIAACALFLDMAYASQRFSEDERQVITDLLVRHFGLDTRGAMALMAEAGRQLTATPDGTFVRQLVAEYDAEQRRMLADLIWEVARADGFADRHEAYLASRLEHQLGVTREAAKGSPQRR